MTKAEVLERLRRHCLGLGEAEEVVKWGDDVVFQVGGKMFAVFGEWRGDMCLTVKVGKEAMGVFLEDARYFEAPYVGKHGWVSLRLGPEMEEEEVEELVRGSYELVTSPKRRSRQPRAGG